MHSCRGLTSGRNSSCCKCTREAAFAFPRVLSGNLRTAQLLVKRVLRCIKSMPFFLLPVGRRVTFGSRIKLKAGNFGVKLRGLSKVGAEAPPFCRVMRYKPKSSLCHTDPGLKLWQEGESPTNFHRNPAAMVLTPCHPAFTVKPLPPPGWRGMHNQNGAWTPGWLGGTCLKGRWGEREHSLKPFCAPRCAFQGAPFLEGGQAAPRLGSGPSPSVGPSPYRRPAGFPVHCSSPLLRRREQLLDDGPWPTSPGSSAAPAGPCAPPAAHPPAAGNGTPDCAG